MPVWSARGWWRKGRIEVFYVPSCSPEINPNEYFKRDFKTEFRSFDRITSRKVLLRKANTFMKRPVKAPERVMAYSKHSAVQYAALFLFDCPVNNKTLDLNQRIL